MSRQFSFFLTGRDAELFEAAILEDGQTVFLRDRPLSATPQRLTTAAASNVGGEWPRVLLARDSDADAVVFTPIRSRLDFSSNTSSQPIIEFDRCLTNAKSIVAGRLYFTASYFKDGHQRAEKSTEFVRWADDLFRRCKKRLKHLGLGYYAGPAALSAHLSGIEFNTGVQQLRYSGGVLEVVT